MTPRKAKDLLERFYGHAAVNAFDPLWPETMVGVAPGAAKAEVLASLRGRLAVLSAHPHDEDAHLLARVLRSVAAQMIEGPGADWSPELEAELDPVVLSRPRSDEAPPVRIAHEPIASAAERAFRRQARALVATAGASPRTIAQLYVLADADGLPSAVVDRFIAELVTPIENDEPGPRPGSASGGRHPASYQFQPARDPGSQRLWLAAGAVV
ncbi:MAG TPA: hypothetical protein VEB59_14670, partial [Gemmatimonadales bacterium]|nr:hypothetical protein [Gemmatimonadales bacterium]